MADIRIHREHQLGLAKARKVAWAWAEQVEQKFDMACTVIEGELSDTVEFKRTGVSGRLIVAPDHFDLDAKLGFLLGAFSKTIEHEIEKNLDTLLKKSGNSGARKTTAEYRLLGHFGLRRVYVGLESGHDALLAFVRKPGSSADAAETVRALKAADVQVGVIVMVGLGGRPFAVGHERDTIGTLNAMGLGEGDLVYFSDLVDVPSTSYPALAADAAIAPLSPGERRQQQDRIRAGLRFAGAPPQFASYDIREFTY